jgi:hypothetical protein
MVIADKMQATQTETGALERGHLHAAANQVVGHHVKLAHIEGIHSVVAADGQSVGRAQLHQKLAGIDLYRVVTGRHRPD